MVVKTRKGLFEITFVEAIVEKRVDFNGSRKRMVAVANNTADATGLLIHLLRQNNECFGFAINTNSLFVGNMKNADVEVFFDSLMKDGYADISGFDYQKENENVRNYIFDEGQTKPYICEGFIGMIDNVENFSMNPYQVGIDNEDNEEEEESEDE